MAPPNDPSTTRRSAKTRGTSTADRTPRPVAPILTTEPGRNPNRLSFPTSTDLNASRLINPRMINLDTANRRRTARQENVTISIIAVRSEHTADHLRREAPHSVGLCIRMSSSARYMHYANPAGLPLDEVLPLALETAVAHTPPLSDVTLATPHKHLWDTSAHTPHTTQLIRDIGLNFHARHPTPGDIGATLARMSAMGVTGPIRADYHLYTASITDARNTYACAVLWGTNRALQLMHTAPGSNLLETEVLIAEWAFKQLPQNAELVVRNANPTLEQVWTNPKILTRDEHADLRTSMKGIGNQLRLKNIQVQNTKPHCDVTHDLLAKAVREITANRYSGADMRKRR